MNFIIDKITSSEIASPSTLSCEEYRQISSYDENSILLTTGRRRGNYTICLSDDRKIPCKHTIASLGSKSNPGEMLQEVFSYKAKKSSVLNETIERLFLKPSSLIR